MNLTPPAFLLNLGPRTRNLPRPHPRSGVYNLRSGLEHTNEHPLELPGIPVLTDPQRLELLKLLQGQPQMSQRELAHVMGVSLGKANYCLNALLEKGLVTFGNFRKNPDKRHYAYLLTPAGLEEKTRITMKFLKRKVAEYETPCLRIEHVVVGASLLANVRAASSARTKAAIIQELSIFRSTRVTLA